MDEKLEAWREEFARQVVAELRVEEARNRFTYRTLFSRTPTEYEVYDLRERRDVKSFLDEEEAKDVTKQLNDGRLGLDINGELSTP